MKILPWEEKKKKKKAEKKKFKMQFWGSLECARVTKRNLGKNSLVDVPIYLSEENAEKYCQLFKYKLRKFEVREL